MTSASPELGGGATPAPKRETCLGWLAAAALPAWSQRAVLDTDGSPVLQRYNECGETLVACVVAAVWGVGVSPDAFRAAVQGPQGSALTDDRALVEMLAYGNVVGRAWRNSGASARTMIEAAAFDGRGCLVLGVWPTPGHALHWLLTTGSDGQNVEYLNPWGGNRSSLDWSQFYELYAGQLVEVAAHYHVDVSRRPLPW